MGTYLLIRKDGRTLCSLGSYSAYYDGFDEPDREDIYCQKEDLQKTLTEKICARIGYTPKNAEELDELTKDMIESVDYYIDEFIKIGRQDVLQELKREGFEVIADTAVERYNLKFGDENTSYSIYFKDNIFQPNTTKKVKLEIRPKIKPIEVIEDDLDKILPICKKHLPEKDYKELEKELFERFT